MMQAQQQQQMQMQQEYYGEEEDEDGMQGLYVEGLADRIWDDNEQWLLICDENPENVYKK